MKKQPLWLIGLLVAAVLLLAGAIGFAVGRETKDVTATPVAPVRCSPPGPYSSFLVLVNRDTAEQNPLCIGGATTVTVTVDADAYASLAGVSSLNGKYVLKPATDEGLTTGGAPVAP